MGVAARWGLAVGASAGAFAVAWWACQEQAGLDEGAALGVAGAVLAVVLAVAGWWAGPGAPGRRSVWRRGRRVVAEGARGPGCEHGGAGSDDHQLPAPGRVSTGARRAGGPGQAGGCRGA